MYYKYGTMGDGGWVGVLLNLITQFLCICIQKEIKMLYMYIYDIVCYQLMFKSYVTSTFMVLWQLEGKKKLLCCSWCSTILHNLDPFEEQKKKAFTDSEEATEVLLHYLRQISEKAASASDDDKEEYLREFLQVCGFCFVM